MSELSIELNWKCNETNLNAGKYSNQHAVCSNDRYEILVGAAPDWGGNAANTNPEQALAAGD